MTCRRVAWVHPTCTCGAPLQLGVDHGDDELGNPLCPTCSGCGCEPNERKNMTPEELDALPDQAVVLDADTVPWQKRTGEWEYAHLRYSTAELVKHHHPFTLLHPVPEPDHSMCARLVPQDSETHPWVFKHRNGKAFYGITEHEAREGGYATPEPEPTVMERAADVIAEDIGRHDNAERIAQALAAAGLLVRDGEQ